MMISFQKWVFSNRYNAFTAELLSALNVQTGEEVAIKLEHTKAKHPQLRIEYTFYQIMQGGGKFARISEMNVNCCHH